jgi:3-dehydroshikimate dehydratase
MKLLAFAVGLLAAAGVSLLTAQTGKPAASRVLRVTSGSDDGSSATLRWAIQTSNATPERETIELAVDGSITPKTPLPVIKGPLEIISAAWGRTGVHSVIDGSGYVRPGGPESCPGATAGQYGANVRTMSFPGLQLIDTDDVAIAGVEIRRFCIGVLINRSTRVLIHDSRIVENRGGAGVMLTGDDGQGNPTSTTTVHNRIFRNEFIDNGDGLELTRGAAFNLVADNVFQSTSANPEPGQGIEILRGHDNVVSGNRFEGYSDGLQINWGDRNYIGANTFTGNTFGLNLTGVGNIVDGNTIIGNRVGIAVRPADPSPIVRLTRNRLSGNGQDISRCEAGGSCDPKAPKGAMAFGVPGLEHASFIGSRGRGNTPATATLQHICPENAPACQAPPNAGLVAPTLTAARLSGNALQVTGSITALPMKRYAVEVFGNIDPGSQEAQSFLSESAVVTDREGKAAFTVRVDRQIGDVRLYSITATVTSTDGATSPLSRARVIDAPAPVARQSSSR